MTAAGLVDELADEIALQIALGRFPPGGSLPSIRRMAEQYGVQPSRVQQALGRLSVAGFVEPRHGVGVVVRDIRMDGGIETWRYLFRFSRRLPDLTVANVQEILETLRLFYGAALERMAADPAAIDPAPLRRAVDRLELLTQAAPVQAADVHRAVVHILRTVQASLGGRITVSVLNSMGGMLGDVPEVLEALYSDPAEHVWFWGQVVTAMETRDVELGRQALAVLDAWHSEALRRLRTRLDEPRQAPPA